MTVDDAATVPVDGLPSRRLDTRIRRMGGQFTLAYRDTTVELTESASLLYEHMDGARTVGMLADLLAQTYGLDGDEALDDTRDFIGFLLENSMAVLQGPGS